MRMEALDTITDSYSVYPLPGAIARPHPTFPKGLGWTKLTAA